MTYQPFLPEAAASTISPRHVVVPLRRACCRRRRVLTGRVTTIDQDRKVATITPRWSARPRATFRLPGHRAWARSPHLPDPGLAEQGIGMKGIEKAIGLRNHVLEQLDKADSTRRGDPPQGASPSSSSAAASRARRPSARSRTWPATRPSTTPTCPREDMRFILVDAADKILPEVGPKLGQYGKEHLEGRGVGDLPLHVHGLLRRRPAARSSRKRPRGRLQHHHVDRRPSSRTHGRWPATASRWARAATSTPRRPSRSPAPTSSWAAAGDNARVPDTMAGRKAGVENAWSPAERPARSAAGQGPRRQRDLGMRGFRKVTTPTRARWRASCKGVAMIVMGKMKIKLKGRLARSTCTAATTAWRCRPSTARESASSRTRTLGMFLVREVVSLGAMETPARGVLRGPPTDPEARRGEGRRPGREGRAAGRRPRPRPPDPASLLAVAVLQQYPKGPSAIRGAGGPFRRVPSRPGGKTVGVYSYFAES